MVLTRLDCIIRDDPLPRFPVNPTLWCLEVESRAFHSPVEVWNRGVPTTQNLQEVTPFKEPALEERKKGRRCSGKAAAVLTLVFELALSFVACQMLAVAGDVTPIALEGGGVLSRRSSHPLAGLQITAFLSLL